MSARNLRSVPPPASRVDFDKLPINVAHDNLRQAYATLDLLYELTLSTDADERLESLGAKQLCNLVHGVMLQIEQAREAIDTMWEESRS